MGMSKRKLRKEEVYKYLADSKWHTIGEMAVHFSVEPDTIRRRLRELVSDQLNLIIGRQGYRLLRPKDIQSQADAIEVETMLRWIIQSVSRLALSGKSTKQLAAAASKFLPKTDGERARLRASFVRITHLIDWQESDIL
jgi:DeoR/GlpR family transcriptional regulator of sugar metabolism